MATATTAVPAGDAVPAAEKGRTGKADVERIRIEQHSVSGMLWLAGWLFTIGFLHLPFWKGVLALVVWPYYLGTTFAP